MGKIKVTECGGIKGLKVVEPTVFGDARGYFMETYNYNDFKEAGIDVEFVQDNQSSSHKGVLRGLHFQINYPQDKLVRVVNGEVFDVAVDLREGSETYGKWFGVVLSAENKKQFFIPKGFAHGFLVLSEHAEFVYKCSDFYHPNDEGGLIWNDPDIGVEWPIPEGMELTFSDKDQKWGSFKEYTANRNERLNTIFSLPMDIYKNRRLVAKLAKNDFKTRYAGSYLGIVWAFIQPVITILVYWFVFSVGFRSGTGDLGVPFVLYLVAGIVPWFFFQDALIGGTNSLLEYNYLVKKVVFNISVLPVVKIISAMFVHAFFVLFTIILYAAYGKFPDFYYLQIIYYSVCVFILVLGLSYATSAIVIFFRDLTQIINIVLQVGVWLTPIMWIVEASPLMGHPVIMKILKLNPMYYIVSGYRDTFLMKTWFWEHAGWTVYFWIFTILCFLFGSWVFKRLRIHFADVL